MSEVVLESIDAGHESVGMILNASHLLFDLLELFQDGGKHLMVGLRAGGWRLVLREGPVVCGRVFYLAEDW